MAPAHTAAPTHTATPTRAATPIPNGAPETGGGGTAGLQDGTIFGLGGAAILLGIGFLAYRRRLTRNS